MNERTWNDKLDFLSESHICQWPPVQAGEDYDIQMGIRCNGNENVEYIRLGEFSSCLNDIEVIVVVDGNGCIRMNPLILVLMLCFASFNNIYLKITTIWVVP